MKKQDKLYSLIFPVWAVILFPWLWFALLPVNFAIDSAFLILIYKIYKFDNIRKLYFKTVFKAWIFGILSSLGGYLFMWLFFAISALFGNPEFLSNICASISLNPFSNIFGLILVIIAIIISAIISYFLNIKLTFNTNGLPNRYKHRVATAFAFLTAPYTFLIPTVWFK